MDFIDILLILLGIILGVVIGYFIVNILTNKQRQARTSAEHIISEANKESENLKKEKLLEAKRRKPKSERSF